MKTVVSLTKLLFLLLIFSLSAEEQVKSSWHQYDSKNRIEKWTLTKEKEIEWIYDFAGNRNKFEVQFPYSRREQWSFNWASRN